MNADNRRLLIDIGNTRIKWAIADRGALSSAGDCLHRPGDPAGIAICLDSISSAPSSVDVSNVAGSEAGQALAEAVASRWAAPVRFAVTQAEGGGVRNAYRDHRQMGVDRWLALIAARQAWRRAACVVDAGTAVTIDQLDDSGSHLGGVIVPGLDLMRRSLVTETDGIAAFERSPAARSALGKDTGEAIDGGALVAICALIEDCDAQLRQRCRDTVLVLTGGDADRIAPHLRIAAETRPELVLEGLNIYEFD